MSEASSLYQCFNCWAYSVIWDSNFDYSDFGYEGEKEMTHVRVYVLTNYNTTTDQDLYRIYTIRDIGFDPYVMIYDKPHAPHITKQIQRWCNAKPAFRVCPDFNDYVCMKRRSKDECEQMGI